MNVNKNFMKLPYVELDQITNNHLGRKELEHLAPFIITVGLSPKFAVLEFETFEKVAGDTSLTQGEKVAAVLCQRRVVERVRILNTAEKQALLDERLELERGQMLTEKEVEKEVKDGESKDETIRDKEVMKEKNGVESHENQSKHLKKRKNNRRGKK